MRTYDEASEAFDHWMNGFQAGRPRHQPTDVKDSPSEIAEQYMVPGQEAVDVFLETYDKFDDHRLTLLSDHGEEEFVASPSKWKAARKNAGL